MLTLVVCLLALVGLFRSGRRIGHGGSLDTASGISGFVLTILTIVFCPLFVFAGYLLTFVGAYLGAKGRGVLGTVLLVLGVLLTLALGPGLLLLV